jgi:hypothetical protein
MSQITTDNNDLKELIIKKEKNKNYSSHKFSELENIIK